MRALQETMLCLNFGTRADVSHVRVAQQVASVLTVSSLTFACETCSCEQVEIDHQVVPEERLRCESNSFVVASVNANVPALLIATEEQT